MKTPEEIAMILDNAKRIGCHSVTIDNVVYQLHEHMEIEQKINPSIPDEVKPEDIMAKLSAFDMPSDEEILYFATPYYDQLQAEKELRAQQLKDSELANG